MIIYCNLTHERIFPPISPDIYRLSADESQLSGDHKAAVRLLAFCHQKFSLKQINFQDKLGNLLFQHRMAVEAELAAKWQRADFFWHQVQIELKALFLQRQIWQDLALVITKNLDVEVMNEPKKLRQRLVNELFIDTHCAFYNGLISKDGKLSWSDRAFVHIDYIQQLLDLTSVSCAEVQTLLEEPWQSRINACKAAKKWQLAIKYCQQRLKYSPQNLQFQGELAEVHYLATIAKCPPAITKIGYFQNAKIWYGSIKTLEKHLQKYPQNLTILKLLGSVHHQRAINLAGCDQLAESLVSIQKAIAYNPDLVAGYKARNEMIEMMNQLQADIKNGQRSSPHWVLEGKKGFVPMNAYMNSDLAKEIAETCKVAAAVQMWDEIGLAPPVTEWTKDLATGVMASQKGKKITIQSHSQVTQTALQLKKEVQRILQHPPQTSNKLSDTWHKVVEKKPDLAQLDSSQICAYLERKIFSEPSDRILITPPSGVTAKPPMLKPTSSNPQLSTEPFLPWLMSSQDKRIKLQAIAATLLVLAAGYVVTREQTTATARNTAYQAVLTSYEMQNDRGVLENAVRFFDHPSLLGNDRRMQQVVEIYSESFLRWFAQQPEPTQLNDDAKKHLQRYSQLAEDRK